jgi:hypothetical protein
MNKFTVPMFLSLLFSLSFAFSLPAQDEHDHHHHAAGDLTALERNAGERWATDEPLQQGMEQIRDAFKRRHGAFHDGEMSESDYRELASELGASIDHIFAHCSLPPAADAELHKLLAAMLQARHKLDQADAEGMIGLHRALSAYPEYFVHPGW